MYPYQTWCKLLVQFLEYQISGTIHGNANRSFFLIYPTVSGQDFGLLSAKRSGGWLFGIYLSNRFLCATVASRR